MDNPVYQFNQASWNAMGMDPEQQIDDQAYMALRLSKKLNEQPEIVAADLDKAAQNSLPVNFYKTLDNAELPDNYTKEMLSKSISPLLKRTIATSPERAAYFTKEQLEKWNAVAREAEAFRRHQSYIDSVLQRVEKEGSAKSAEDLEHERWMSVRDARKRQETWKQIQDQAQINKVVNALDAYWPDDFRKVGDRDLQARLEILNTRGIDTSMVDLAELRKTKGYQFREAVNLFGVLDAMENGDNLGWLIANKMTDGAAVDLLSHVDENSPLFVQEKALELLRKERYDAMPETGMEKAFNSLFKSTAFMTEMALTSGMGEAFGLVKAGGAPMLDQLVKDGFLKFIRENGLKGFGQAAKEGIKRAGANTVGRLPVYLPSVTLNTFSEVAPSVVTIPDDFGNPSITVKESDVTDFIQRLVTNTVTQSIEMFTEELGPLIPLGDLDAKMVTAFLPKTVRNFVAQSLIRNPTTRRIAERAILDRVPFDGLIGEFGEEAIGQFMMFGATLLGYGMGFRPENTPGVMSPVMSKEEAGDTLASIALQSVLFRGLQIAHAEFTNRGAIAMIRDAQRAKSDRTHFEAMRDLISETRLPQSNVNEAERTLGLLLNGDAVVSVTPESLEGILQQATEGKTEAEANEARATLEQLGVTTDAIENAKKNGTDVLLSRNRLWAVSSSKGFRNAKELVDRILDNEVSEVFGKTTKEITADSFTKEQIDEMVDRSKRQEDFLLDVQKTMAAAIRTAQKNAIAAGNKLGISQQNVQDFVSIYKWMANYLAENVETEEGLAKLKEMVDNLSVQFAEAPEKFDTTVLNQGVIGLPGFYSNMMQSLEDAPQQKMTPAQWMAYLQKSGGLKAGETSWRGSVEEFFKGRDPKTAIDKQELIDAFQDGMVDLLEIGSGPTDTEVGALYDELFDRRIESSLNRMRKEYLSRFQKDVNNRNNLYASQALQGILDVIFPDVETRMLAGDAPEAIKAKVEAGLSYMTEEKQREAITLYTKMREAADESGWGSAEQRDAEREWSHFNQGLYEAMEDGARDIPEPAKHIKTSTVREEYTTDGLENKRELVIYAPEVAPFEASDDIHFGTDTKGTALVWVRFGETTDADGKRVLVIDEIQSNRHQQGREKGYRGHRKPDGAFGAVQNASVDAVRDDILNGGRVIWIDVFDANNPSRSARFLVRDGAIENYEAHDYAEHPDLEALVGMGVREAFGGKVADWYAEIDKTAKSAETEQDAAVLLGWSHVVVADDVRADRDAIPAAPFEKNWQELGMKRMIRYAAENGFDKIAWTSGEQQAKRYNIGKVLSGIERRGLRTLAVGDRIISTAGYASQEDIEELGFNEDEAWFLLVLLDQLDRRGSFASAMKNAVAAVESMEDSEMRSGTKDDLREFAKTITARGEGREFFANREGGGRISFSVDENGIVDSSSMGEFEGNDVRELFGKELGTQIMDIANDKADNDIIQLDENVVIGGEGMKTFYDKILKNFTDKYIKKWGSKVGVVELPEVEDAGREMWGFDVTDKMKEDVMTKGQPLFQGNTILKGQINLARFAESQQAIISLFRDADASTLPHESAHWLKAAMESLVGAGFATDKMKQDLDTINAWLDKQDYTGAVTDQDKYRAREEYFARAFEQYLREGRFPEAATNGLKSALRRLARMLQSIYRNALALNAPIDDSIRGFFDDIFAVEEVVDGTSVLSGILREINTGALAFSKEDLKKLETSVAGAREDAETEAWLAALQDYQKGLKEQQKIWRNEAKEAYDASKAEHAYTYVRNGHKLDENFLRNVLKLDEETISILKKKRLTYKAAPVETPVEAPANAETAAPAVEPASTETPASTASAEAQEPVVLSGLVPDTKAAKEAWDAVGRNDVISIQDVDTLAAILYAIIKRDDSFGEKVNDVYTRLTGTYRNGGERYKATGKGKLYTKGLFESTVKKIIHNENVDAFEEEAKTDSLQAPIQGKDDGGKVRTVEDVTPDEVRNGAFEDEGLDIRVRAFNDYIATLKPGSFKREVAELLREFSMDEEEMDFSVDDMLEAYMERHQGEEGVKGKTTFYDAVKKVRAELRKFMARDEYQQSLDVETPASILDTMKELDYGDVNDFITDLKTALGRSAFIKDYMNRKHAEYRNAFLDNPNWASEAGATRYLDAILRALKVTEGMKFSERARIAASEATRELMASANVRDVMNGERGVATSLRSNAAKVLRALKSGKEDKAAAITAALDMYRNDARLRAIRKLRADIQKTLNRAKRIGNSKPGSTLDGDTINAVKALLNRFGMSSAEPQWTTGPGDPQSVLAVMKEFTPDLEAELTHWSPWMNRVLTGEEAKTSWQNLTPEQFYELTDLIDYLRGEGRASLAEIKGTFANEFATAMDAILPSLDEHKTGDYTDTVDKTMMQKLGSLARSGVHQMKTLLFLCHLLDGRTEFYGDHTIGPVRKFFQLPLSEGASRELYWYQKVSKEIKPHVLALMKTAKDRKLVFPVNNEETRRRAYPDIHGEAAAFVLLNAGAAENRQRLMESFGWSEDELNGLLAQFTKEDFEHAEAIWKSLREMGTELAKVYFEERHYRMKWAELAPLHLVLNDGTEILSDGGYYPLAYRYHDSGRGYDPDIMNPFTQANRPSRPSSVRERKTNLTDLSLLMSPSVVEQSVRESAHYIGMWKPLHLANAIWSDKAFKQSVIRNFGMETYDALKQLMNHVNNPSDMERGLWKKAAQKLGASLSTMALGFKLPTMAKQYASLTIGADRLGDYFTDAVGYALRDLRGLRREVSKMSPFMRDRYNLMDLDLRVVDTEFKGPVGKAADKYRYAAFFGLKWNDLNVAAVQWYAAYNWAIHTQADMTASQARAYADDFVASTQGAARTIDTPVVQLEALGRLMTPFFGPACASANTRLAGLAVMKQMTAGERIAFAVDNFMVPGLAMALIAAVQSGLMHPDDDDDWDRIRKRSLTALLTEPVSGVPVIQDIADAAVRSAVTGKPVQNGIFEVSLFRPAEEASRDFINLLQHWDNAGYSLYIGASLAGQLVGMPVVQVYEDYEKMILWNFGDESSKTLKKQLQGEKRK